MWEKLRSPKSLFEWINLNFFCKNVILVVISPVSSDWLWRPVKFQFYTKFCTDLWIFFVLMAVVCIAYAQSTNSSSWIPVILLYEWPIWIFIGHIFFRSHSFYIQFWSSRFLLAVVVLRNFINDLHIFSFENMG